MSCSAIYQRKTPMGRLGPALLVAIGLVVAAAAHGGDPDEGVGTTATSVMRLGLGARPAALGHAYAAIYGDPTTLLINPAGLARVPRLQLDLHHHERFVDTHVSTLALAWPVGPTTVGVGAAYLDAGYIDEIVNFRRTGVRLHSSDLDLMLGLGGSVAEVLHLGARLDIRHSVVASAYDETGAAFAAGAQLAGWIPYVDLGIAVENLGADQSLEGSGRQDPLPRTVRGGAALHFLSVAPGQSGPSLTAVADLWRALGSRFQWGSGAELGFHRIAQTPVGLAARAGYRSGGYAGDDLRNLTAGVGLKVGYLTLDYAFEDFSTLEDLHRISVGLMRTDGSPGAARRLDADHDGVPDERDFCPETPVGADVDRHGCPRDTDGDGVYDGLDHCPETPSGALVSQSGCPLDSDFDGVFDGLDRCPDSRPGTQVDGSGCEVLITPGRFQLPIVYFAFDDHEILDSEVPKLIELGETMMAWPELRVRVAGHTDGVGHEWYNAVLSERRARAVIDALVERFPGIDPSRLLPMGLGEYFPVESNQDSQGRRQNRRVIVDPMNGSEPRGH